MACDQDREDMDYRWNKVWYRCSVCNEKYEAPSYKHGFHKASDFAEVETFLQNVVMPGRWRTCDSCRSADRSGTLPLECKKCNQLCDSNGAVTTKQRFGEHGPGVY